MVAREAPESALVTDRPKKLKRPMEATPTRTALRSGGWVAIWKKRGGVATAYCIFTEVSPGPPSRYTAA